MSDILFEIKEGDFGQFGFITLNRPKALNALTADMLIAMSKKLQEWADDNSIVAVIVNSNSEKAFCAGGDVVSLYKNGRQHKEKAMDFFWHEYRLNHLIHHYPKPYIPILNGITMGGGVGVSLHGNCPVATENFSFAMPETGIGFFPDVGGSFLLANRKDSSGYYLGLTGSRISVSDTYYYGLTPHVIKNDDINSLVDALLHSDLTENPVTRVHQLFNEYTFDADESSLKLQASLMRSAFSKDSVSDIVTALESDGSEWAVKTLKTLSHKSPLSLAVTFEQLRRAKTLDMGQCMQMEYRMVSRFIDGDDFYEGVRALLIDKDKSPKWSHSSIAEVKADEVGAYFAPLDAELSLQQSL
jgi:enoyl-CoA hydratase/carnithine racemase